MGPCGSKAASGKIEHPTGGKVTGKTGVSGSSVGGSTSGMGGSGGSSMLAGQKGHRDTSEMLDEFFKTDTRPAPNGVKWGAKGDLEEVGFNDWDERKRLVVDALKSQVTFYIKYSPDKDADTEEHLMSNNIVNYINSENVTCKQLFLELNKMLHMEEADEEWTVRAEELQRKITDQYDPDDFEDPNDPSNKKDDDDKDKKDVAAAALKPDEAPRQDQKLELNEDQVRAMAEMGVDSDGEIPTKQNEIQKFIAMFKRYQDSKNQFFMPKKDRGKAASWWQYMNGIGKNGQGKGEESKKQDDDDDLSKQKKRTFTRRPPIYKALIFRDDDESSKEDYDAMLEFISSKDSVFNDKVTGDSAFKDKVTSIVGNPDAVKQYLEDIQKTVDDLKEHKEEMTDADAPARQITEKKKELAAAQGKEMITIPELCERLVLFIYYKGSGDVADGAMRVGASDLDNDQLFEIDKKLNGLAKSPYVMTVGVIDAARRPGDTQETGGQLSDKRSGSKIEGQMHIMYALNQDIKDNKGTLTQQWLEEVKATPFTFPAGIRNWQYVDHKFHRYEKIDKQIPFLKTHELPVVIPQDKLNKICQEKYLDTSEIAKCMTKPEYTKLGIGAYKQN